MGNVQIVAAGTAPLSPEPQIQLPADVASISFRSLLAESEYDPVAIPGVQDKISGRMINVPAARRGERLIVKLDPPEYPHVVRNEAAMLQVARAAGLRVPDWAVVTDADGVDALLVTRFDRILVDGAPRSLGCEDASQVLGLWPADKYTPSYEQVVEVLAAPCAASPVAVRNLFGYVVFAVLSGNGDFHAKNASILRTVAGEWMVSPAYDLVSTAAYGDHSLALTLGGSRSGVSRKRLLAFADDIGLPSRAATRVLDTLLTRTAEPFTNVAAFGLPYDRAATHAWQEELNYRRRLLVA